jgi:hypothetical protein
MSEVKLLTKLLASLSTPQAEQTDKEAGEDNLEP